MWEVIKDIPRGRLSLRKYLRFVPALLVACLLYIFATSPVALAADATWSGETLIYKDIRYTGPVEAKSGDSHNIPAGSQIYGYVDEGKTRSDPSVAHFIYFPPKSDPATANSAQYVVYTFTPPDNYSNPSPPKTISVDEMSFAKEISTCAVDGIGWIICPVTSFLAKGMDWLYAALSKMLEVQPLQSDTNNPLYRSWDITRNIANIAFVIAFLIVIYSQLVGGGLSNYTMKKMLPRLVIAAILVNVSYWICAVGVDISNILGYSVQDLFTNMRQAVIGPLDGGKLVNWESMTTFLLAGGTATAAVGIGAVVFLGGGAGVGALFLLLPMLLIVLTAVLVAMFVMVARQAFITILIVVAPLAFVAYLLPNTEKWFEKWRQVFMTMLLLFPIFSLIFGGSQLAGTIIIHNADSFLLVLLGMGVQVAPIVITPMLVKFSGGLLGRLAGMVNNPNKGLIDRTRNWSQGKFEQDRARRNSLLNNPEKPLRKRQVALRYAQRYQNKKRDNEGWKKGNEERAESLYHGTKGHQAVDSYNRRTDQTKRAIEGHHDKEWYGQFDRRSSHYNEAGLTKEMATRAMLTEAEGAKNFTDTVQAEINAGKNPSHALGYADVETASFSKIIVRSQAATQNVALTSMRKQMAERKLTELHAKEISENELLQIYAGGIMGRQGQQSVRANAKTTASKLFLDDIKNIEDTLEYDVATNIDTLKVRFRQSGTMAERVAYANVLARSDFGIAQLKKSIVEYENASPAHSDLMDFKELIGINSNVRLAGVDLDNWITNKKFDGQNIASFETVSNSIETWKNLSADKFAAMKASSQFHAINILRSQNPATYDTLVQALKDSPEKRGDIRVEVLKEMGILQEFPTD